MKKIFILPLLLLVMVWCSVDRQDSNTGNSTVLKKEKQEPYNPIFIEKSGKDNIDLMVYTKGEIQSKDIVIVDSTSVSQDGGSDRIQWLDTLNFIKLIPNFDESNPFDPQLLGYDFQKINIDSWAQEIVFSINGDNEIKKWLVSWDQIFYLVEENAKIVFYVYNLTSESLKKIWSVYEGDNIYRTWFSHIQKLWNDSYGFLMEKEDEDQVFKIKYSNDGLNISRAFSYDEILENGKTNVNFISPSDMCIIWDTVVYTKEFSDYGYELIELNTINSSSSTIDGIKSSKEYVRAMKCVDNTLYFEKNIIWDSTNRFIYTYDSKSKSVDKLVNWLLVAVNEEVLIYEFEDKFYLYDLQDKTNHFILDAEGLTNIYIK